MTYADVVKLAGHELAIMAKQGELSRARAVAGAVEGKGNYEYVVGNPR